jgi:hypothetical protein
LTQELAGKGLVKARRDGKEWRFVVKEHADALLQSPGRSGPEIPIEKITAAQFETLSRQVFSRRFGVPLEPGQAPGVPKLFDLLSPDHQIVGDAKYYTLVGGQHLPPAKFSIIAEHVWLLEKTQARHQFLVFGNDIEVPRRWLARYGHLRGNVVFYFLTPDAHLEELA